MFQFVALATNGRSGLELGFDQVLLADGLDVLAGLLTHVVGGPPQLRRHHALVSNVV